MPYAGIRVHGRGEARREQGNFLGLYVDGVLCPHVRTHGPPPTRISPACEAIISRINDTIKITAVER